MYFFVFLYLQLYDELKMIKR